MQMHKTFDATKVTTELIEWIRAYFKDAGPTSKAVVGISGGKDSSVVAALCAQALGKDRVLGVLMPSGEQHDIQYSYDLCEAIGIPHLTIDIKDAVEAEMRIVTTALESIGETVTTVTTFNTPARIRMTTLYGVSGTVGGRVANTCNLSEDWVGYATKYGDGAGDFSPLMMLTVQEVRAVGRVLGLPEKLVAKTPIDGLCGKTDEENLGFTYEMLDTYIRTGVCEDEAIKQKIDRMHAANLHKITPMPRFEWSV